VERKTKGGGIVVSRQEWAEMRKREKRRLGRQRRMGGLGSEGGDGSGGLGRRLGVWERGCRGRGMIRADICDGIVKFDSLMV
jgi:hypothetical protein